MTAQMEITQAMIELRLENVILREENIKLRTDLLIANAGQQIYLARLIAKEKPLDLPKVWSVG